MEIKITGTVGDREYRPSWNFGALFIPAKAEVTLNAEMSAALLKCKKDLELIKSMHKVNFMNQQFSSKIETEIKNESSTAIAADEEAVRRTINSAKPQISKAKSEEELKRFLESDIIEIRETAERKLARLKEAENDN